MPQEAALQSDKTLSEELRSVFDRVDDQLRECDELAHRMAEVDHDSEEYRRIASRYGGLQHELDRQGAYEIDAQIKRVAAGLGFQGSDHARPCAEFSGGWQMRIMLASLLLTNPDVLLLDEPTNHLDLESMIWLESWIRERDATVLLVSHERKFMDALVTKVLDVHESKLTVYAGNYTRYLTLRAERWNQWQREYDNQQEEIRHQQKFIDRFRYNNKKATLVQSRIRALEKIKRISPPPQPPPSIQFRFPTPDRGSKEVFSLEGVTKAYGEIRVLEDVDFKLWRGEKVALVGLNGAGKTTLLKMLAGAEQPGSGKIVRGVKNRAEYFAQYDHEGLISTNTVGEEIASAAPAGHLDEARRLLGGFFFSGQDIEKPVSVLSGGEKTRLRLAKMLFSGVNVLLLDEPTNHLDIASRSTLETALRSYEGALVLVSHDRAFLDRVATRIVEIKDGKLRSFPGNYTDYCHQLRALGETSPLVEPVSSPGGRKEKRRRAKPNLRAKKGAQSQPSAPEPADPREASRQVSRERRRLQKLVAQLELEIGKVEARLAEIEEELSRSEVYRDHTKSVPLVDEQTSLKEHHAAYVQQWERNAMALEGA